MNLICKYTILSVAIIGIIITSVGKAFAQRDIQISENYLIYPGTVTQTEVFITTSPLDENLFFSSCNTLTFIPFFVSEGIYVSQDGGSSWRGNDTCTGQYIDFHGGDPGIAIDAGGRFVLTRLGRTPLSGLYAHFSYDNGKTWTVQTSISNDDLERASVATDFITGSPNYGNTYASWVKFSNPFPIVFSKVAQDSESFSAPLVINSPDNRSAGGDIAVGPDGEVYVCWAGVSDQSPFRELFTGFASSNNAGNSWTVTENAFNMNGITGLLPEKGNIRVNGLPSIAVDCTQGPRKGWIYIVTGQRDMLPAGNDPDIILNISKDGGNSWSQGIRVNQDELNNGKIQYFPAIHIDKYGGINILYYDDRNTTQDSTGVYMSRSLDGGETWTDHQISDHNFKPEAIGGLGQGYQGDNIDIASTSEKLIPVWMDNSTGHYQIWSANIRFSDIDQIEEFHRKDDYDFSVYPNPATNQLNISFTTKKDDEITVTLVNMTSGSKYEVGKYHISKSINQFNISTEALKLENGLYLVVTNSEDIIRSQKLLLINDY